MAQSEGAQIAIQYPASLIVVRQGPAAVPISRLLSPGISPQDQQNIRQNFDLAGVSVARIDLLDTGTLSKDLDMPGTALIVQGPDIANPLLADIFRAGMRFYVFSQSAGLTRASLSRPDGTRLTTEGTPYIIGNLNRNVIVTSGNPANGIQTLLYPPGASIALVNQVVAQAGLTPQTIMPFDNINLTQLANPGTALLNGEVMFLDPAADFVLNFAPNMGIYFIENRVVLEDITPSGLIEQTAPAVAHAANGGVAPPSRIVPAAPAAPTRPATATAASTPRVNPPAPQSPPAPADPITQIVATDPALLDGYVHVSSSRAGESFIRPGFCDTGVADILVVQYQLEASPEWGAYVGRTRSTLKETSRWRDENCAGDRTLNVAVRLVFDGVEHGRFTARITDANRISDPVFEALAPPPEETAFSRAIEGTRFADFRIFLPRDWIPGNPPGLTSQADARFAHALYVEGLAAKPHIYTWTDESLQLFQTASALGHRGATEELLNHADFRNVLPRVFYNLSQGNPPIDEEIAGLIASHGALYQTAIDQRIGYYMYLDAALAEYDFDITDGMITLNENAPPNHYDLTNALNAANRDGLNPASAAYVALMGLSRETGWVCDGTWCEAMGGLARMRFLVQYGTADCTLNDNDHARCQFGLVPVFRTHQMLEGTAQQRSFSWMMAPQRARAIPATADLVRTADGWKIVGSIDLR